MMKIYLTLVLVFLFGVTAGPRQVKAQEASDSSVGRELGTSPNPSDEHDPPDWLFPINELDRSLPGWIHIGGQYRNRLEAPSGIGSKALLEGLSRPFEAVQQNRGFGYAS